MLLGYSRIPYAAAVNGGFFRVFAAVDPVRKFPIVSLGFLGFLTAIFCFFPLQLVIEAAVIVRVAVQFIVQIIALHILRTARPDIKLPFRMWFYPLPSLVALAGWIFLVVTAETVILWIGCGGPRIGLSGVRRLEHADGDRQTECLHELLSGRQWNSPLACDSPGFRLSGVSRLLGLWELWMHFRNTAFDRGLKRSFRAAVPVISIGNLTTGGTGKTPIAAFLARWFGERGVKVCFVSRGYGAAGNAPNDEALVLRALCPDVPHLQNPDRVAAARAAVETHKSQLVILDDGFQHRRLARDLDVVLIDATNPWGYGYILPRGLLREPISSLRRARLVMITRVDRTPRRGDQCHSTRRLRRGHPACEIVEAAFPPARLINSQGQAASLETLRGRSAAVFCGIGNPTAFLATLESLGCDVADIRAFPDHHNFTPADVADLQQWVRGLAVDTVVCTQKDLVKFTHDSLGDRPLWAVEIGTHIVAGEDLLSKRLQSVLSTIC